MRWQRIGRLDFGVKTFIVPGQDERTVFFVSAESVLQFDLRTRKEVRYPFSPRLPVENMANQFICDPFTGQLLICDFERALPGYISHFNLQTGSWLEPLQKKIESGFQHHNSFFLLRTFHWFSSSDTVFTVIMP